MTIPLLLEYGNQNFLDNLAGVTQRLGRKEF
jgi:hypothetical protein